MIESRLVAALGWTLVHSLWQGLVAAFLVCAGLIFLRKHRPETRYALLVAGLVSLPAAALTTFLRQWRLPQAELMVDGAALLRAAGEVTSGLAPGAADAHGFSVLPYLVGLWLTGMVLVGLRALGGYWHTRRLLTREAVHGDAARQRLLDMLSARMGLLRRVRLLVSDRVSVPMVIGHLKPVVLMPLSVLCALPPAEIEAVLLHELGHIKRNDYLVNIVQTVLETVFFYHPAVWWLSRRIRSERELCCDDLAVAAAGDPLTFARALAHLQEVNMQIPKGAMAATGHGALFARIKRLMEPDERTTGPLQAVCTVLLVTAGVLIPARCTAVAHAAAQTQEEGRRYAFLEPLLPEDGEGLIDFNNDDRRLRLRFENHRLVSFQVNGEERPLDDVLNYQKDIEHMVERRVELDARRLEMDARREEMDARREEMEARTEELAERSEVLRLEKIEAAEAHRMAAREAAEEDRVRSIEARQALEEARRELKERYALEREVEKTMRAQLKERAAKDAAAREEIEADLAQLKEQEALRRDAMRAELEALQESRMAMKERMQAEREETRGEESLRDAMEARKEAMEALRLEQREMRREMERLREENRELRRQRGDKPPKAPGAAVAPVRALSPAADRPAPRIRVAAAPVLPDAPAAAVHVTVAGVDMPAPPAPIGFADAADMPEPAVAPSPESLPEPVRPALALAAEPHPEALPAPAAPPGAISLAEPVLAPTPAPDAPVLPPTPVHVDPVVAPAHAPRPDNHDDTP